MFRQAELRDWHGLGLAVQAYQTRALDVIEWLAGLACECGKRLPLRLVKGAYWDTEVKRAQVQGLPHYPVFTRKAATDVSYLACAKRILAVRDAFHAQFATHNAHSVAYVIEVADGSCDFEFQRLHGMGEALYAQINSRNTFDLSCRVYAPVGSHRELLPYLVRRLLENGANTSFVNRIVDAREPVDKVIADPVAQLRSLKQIPNPHIALPLRLYGAARRNSLSYGADYRVPQGCTTQPAAKCRVHHGQPQVAVGVG